MSGRRRYKESIRRKKRSSKAMSKLSNIISSPHDFPLKMRNIAVRDMMLLSKRHGTKFNSLTKISICKICKSVMNFGVDSRVRIRDKSIVITCERCNNKTRRPIKR